jgi:hypothetical protein
MLKIKEDERRSDFAARARRKWELTEEDFTEHLQRNES